MASPIQFTKMHGAGNDYIFIDTARFPVARPEELARLWSDRHTGIGADGLILICPPGTAEADFRMRMFNSDGSEGRMCGNGIRCFAKYVYENGLTDKTLIRVETLAGIRQLSLHLDTDGSVDSVTVDMGAAVLSDPALLATADGTMLEGIVEHRGVRRRGTFISMGNPHFVCFVDDVDGIDIAREGEALEVAPVFPERCNIEFATVRPDGTIRMRVWERGTGSTLACGTGACATAVAARLTNRAKNHATILMDGGRLDIEITHTGTVLMTGMTATVFHGEITPPDRQPPDQADTDGRKTIPEPTDTH